MTAYVANAGDTAVLYDTTGNDTFYGSGGSGTLVASTGVTYGTNGFGNVAIDSVNGGYDQAFTSGMGYTLTKYGPWH